MKQKRKKLKGFTLVELVVVMALFGMIIAVALGLLQPVRNINNYALKTADSQSMGEELRRYIEGKLQYANRVAIYTNMTLPDVQDEVDNFRDMYQFDARTAPYSGYKDTVYVMHIDNHSDIQKLVTDKTIVNRDDRIGTIELSVYEKGVEKPELRREWELGSTYYNDYAFNIDLGTLVADASEPSGLKIVSIQDSTTSQLKDKDGNPIKTVISPNNLIFSIDMYRKNKEGSINQRVLTSTGIRRNVSFKLKNVVNSSNAIIDEKIPFDDEAKTNSTPPVKKFNWYDNTLPNADGTVTGATANAKDIYIFYTTAIDVEKILK